MKKSMKYLILLPILLIMSNPGLASELSPESIAGATTIDTAAAKVHFDNEVAFVDPRKDSDWDAGRIPGAIHLDFNGKLTEESLSAVVKKDEPVVFYCNGIKCMLSPKAVTKAVSWGFTKVYFYREGFPEWKKANHPVE